MIGVFVKEGQFCVVGGVPAPPRMSLLGFMHFFQGVFQVGL